MPIRQPDKSKLTKDASGFWRRPRGNTPLVYVKQPEGTYPPYQRVKAIWDFQNGMWIEPTGIPDVPNNIGGAIPDVTNTTTDATNGANEATHDDITEDTNEERQSKKSKTAGEMTGTISNNLTHCPVCMDWYRKEIFQCDKGHLICSECKESLTNNKCPTCRVDISNIRNRALEDLLETVARPCSFSTNGCKFIGVKADLIKHEKECDNMIMVCPEKECNCTVSPNCMMTHLINMHVHKLLPKNKPKIYHFRQEIVFDKYPIVKFELELPEDNSMRTTLLQFGSHALFMFTCRIQNYGSDTSLQNNVCFSAKTIFEDTSRHFLRKSNKSKKEITELLKNTDQSPYTHISVKFLGQPDNSFVFPLPLTKLNKNKKEFYIFDNTNNEYPYKTNDVKFPLSMFSKEILSVKNNRVSVSVTLQPGRKFCEWELSEVYQKTSEEWYEEAVVYRDNKEWQKCINSLRNCVFLDQEHKDAWFALGDALYQKNKTFIEECYTPYVRCIELDSNNYPAKWNLSLVFEHVAVKRDLVAALKLVEDCEEANAKLINCDIKKRLRSLRNRITREKKILRKTDLRK